MSQETNTVAWWRLLNRYQWFVLIVAAAGWLLDCMDQQLFNLARTPAMKELLKGTFAPDATPAQIAASVQEHAGYSTAIFLLGWATGGLIFGVLGDRIGRAKTMLITILMYSGCTGLSALSQAFWDFALYRFITGLGVGGEFAVGVALVAEVMPDKARPYALSLLQALSTVGNSAQLSPVSASGIWRPRVCSDPSVAGPPGAGCSLSVPSLHCWWWSSAATSRSRNAGCK